MFKYECDTCSKWHGTDLKGASYLIRERWPFRVGLAIGNKTLTIFRGWAAK